MAKSVGVALLLLFAAGCGAAYSRYMNASLKRLEQSDYAGALAKLEKPDGKTNKLLYRFEKGLIHHYQGEYDLSNQEFEKAERLIDQLYTKSISRELAALVTNDAIRAYSGEEFERAFIHYYRALNYCYLDDLEAPLRDEVPEKPGQALQPGIFSKGFSPWRASNVRPQAQPGYVVATVRLPLGDFTSAGFAVPLCHR